MTRTTLIPTVTLLAVIALVGFVTTDRAPAAELQVISNNSTAHLMALQSGKSIAIDLPTDFTNLLVADPETVTAFVASSRRVYLVGKAQGQTNVFFIGADGRQVAALDIIVTRSLMYGSTPATSELYASPANTVVVFRGGQSARYECTPNTCLQSLSEKEVELAKTQFTTTTTK